MNEDKVIITVDQKAYSLSAVKRAAYDFTDKAYIEISCTDDNSICLSIHLKENSPSDTIQELLNHILDHQVRIDLEKEFGVLRNIIAAQAFDLVTPDLEKSYNDFKE